MITELPVVVSAVALMGLPVLPLSAITLVLLLVQMPPAVASEIDTGLPAWDMLTGPLIGVIVGIAFTVTVCVVIQLPAALLLKVIVATPAPSPEISPPEAIAIAVLLLDQLDTGEASESMVTKPTHKLKLPMIGCGFAYTVLLIVV